MTEVTSEESCDYDVKACLLSPHHHASETFVRGGSRETFKILMEIFKELGAFHLSDQNTWDLC